MNLLLRPIIIYYPNNGEPTTGLRFGVSSINSLPPFVKPVPPKPRLDDDEDVVAIVLAIHQRKERMP